jgi:hypothetical protein
MQVRSKYRSLSRGQLLDKAYELGANFEKNSRSCSQCTVAALHELLDFDDILVKVATSSCGGQARRVEGTCGAVIGGTLVLDYFFGRPSDKLSYETKDQENVNLIGKSISVAELLSNKFEQMYGTILCPGIHVELFGRAFHFKNPAEGELFEQAGAHSDPSKCMNVVGNGARWTLEIILDKGAVELSPVAKN